MNSSVAMNTMNIDFYQQLLEQTSKARNELMTLPVVQQTLAGDVTIARYRAFLTQAYHHVRHTVSLMMACGSRLSAEQNWIQPMLIEYINEEAGHEQWILNDLKTIGADPVEVISQGPSFETELMLAYAYDSIHRGNPISFFGMVHVLEGTSTALACNAAEQTQRSLNLPDEAFSYLNSHGALDQGHVQFFADLVNRLDSQEDRHAVIHSANSHYKLYGNILNSLH